MRKGRVLLTTGLLVATSGGPAGCTAAQPPPDGRAEQHSPHLDTPPSLGLAASLPRRHVGVMASAATFDVAHLEAPSEDADDAGRAAAMAFAVDRASYRGDAVAGRWASARAVAAYAGERTGVWLVVAEQRVITASGTQVRTIVLPVAVEWANGAWRARDLGRDRA